MTVSQPTITGSKQSSAGSAKRASDVAASLARNHIHVGFHFDDDSPPIRSLHPVTGKSFYKRPKVPCGKQVRLLFDGARQDVKERRVFSPYNADQILSYFDGVIGLVSVFLYEQLGWERTLNVKEDPTPVLLSLLCFFHVMVYWLNVHHFLKFSSDRMSLVQVWLLILFCLGLVMYPLSLVTLIESGNFDSYCYINTGCCFIFWLFNLATRVNEDANSLFWLWHRGAPLVAFLFYGVVSILNFSGIKESRYVLYISPFFFMFPLGGAKKQNSDGNDEAKLNIFLDAFRDMKTGNLCSPYPIDCAFGFYDAVIGLATVFIFINLGEDSIEGEGHENLLENTGLPAAMLCFFHVMVFWLNIHHSIKFSPRKMTILQVWCVVFFSLGMIFYPLCISAWIEEGNVQIYYSINLALYAFGILFSFLTKIEKGQSSVLYRFYHKISWVTSLVWYSIAYILLKTGNEQRWMIIVAPVMAMFPLGGEGPSSANNIGSLPEKDDEDSQVNYPNGMQPDQHDGDFCYECPYQSDSSINESKRSAS